MNARVRWRSALWLLALTFGLVGSLWWMRGSSAQPAEASSAQADAAPSTSRPTSASAVPPPQPGPELSPVPPSPVGDAGSTASVVDLERLRRQLPDNLYWTEGSPTDDPAELRARAEAAAHWNALYGKVLSGEASEEEIHAYFAHRRQVSEDYLAFSLQVLENQGDQLSERERGLHQLSIRLHRARLAELPREESDALERSARKARERARWLEAGGGGG